MDAPSFLDVIQSVKKLESLDSNPITIKCWSQDQEEFETITFEAAYPFTTIDDIKSFLYSVKKSPDWTPPHIFLGTVFGTATDTNKDKFIGTDILWFSEANEDSYDDYIILSSPLLLCQQKGPIDRQFVDASGEAKLMRQTPPRGRSTLEDLYPEGSPTFYAFCMADMAASFGVSQGRPISNRDWNGRFSMFFPALKANDYMPSQQDIENANRRLRFFDSNQKIIEAVDAALQEEGHTVPLKVETVLALKLLFDYRPHQGAENIIEGAIPFRSLEELFFDIDVNEYRPFMRLLPAKDEPLTKIHVRGALPIPNIADPSLILQWKDYISPNDEEDFLFLKVAVRGLEQGALPLYATLRIMQDGSANILLIPSKQHRLGLDPVRDLKNFDKIIFESVQGTHLAGKDILLNEISIGLNLHLQPEDTALTKKLLQTRLGSFAYFLQEIPNYVDAERQPIILLRYRAVSQFAVESNIFIYIRQHFGKTSTNDILNGLSSEFGITTEEAKKALWNYLENASTFTITQPELFTFTEDKNSGIDIGIYGAHPNYQIRISRCNSMNNLLRIYSIISLFLSADIDININPKVIETVKKLEPAVAAATNKDEDDMEEGNLIIESGPAKKIIDLIDYDSEDDLLMAPIAAPSKPLPAKPVFVDALMYDDDDDISDLLLGGGVNPSGVRTLARSRRGGGRKPAPKPEDQEAELVAKGYYLKKLRDADVRLFEFTPKTKGELTYVRKCQANDNRYPVALTEKEYRRMLEEYEGDANIIFVEYPLRQGETEPPQIEGQEYITVLKYGTIAAVPNYYFCPLLFCLKDRIMVRPNDFEGTRWRPKYDPGYPKEVDSCPFCGGKEITNFEIGKKGYTVLRRGATQQSTTSALYIDFVGNTTHPDSFELPCCAKKLPKKPYRITDPAFKEFLQLIKKEQPEIETVNTDIENAVVAALDNEVDYELLRYHLPKEYISDPGRHPLKPGVIGQLPVSLDKFFEQNSMSLVKRVAIKQELKTGPGNKGFLRMGVQGSRTNDPNGFFGALVPYLYKTSIDQIIAKFDSVFNPKIFINANYGNLVHEFYNPCDPIPTEEQLSQWAAEQLNVMLNTENEYEIRRAYMSHAAFIKYLHDKNSYKEYRLFAPILAYKGLLSANGLILIVVEYNSAKPEQAPRIICPPFGYNPKIHTGCDFGFVLRDENNIYESLFYYEWLTKGDGHTTAVKFNPEMQKEGVQIPPVVLKKINEFKQNCEYVGRAIYTASAAVKSQDLLTLSDLIDSPYKKYINGVVRDVYNHIVGVTMTSGTGRLIPFPVADDGYMPLDLYTYFDWSSCPVNSADKIYEFYTNQLAPLLNDNPGYAINQIFRLEGAKTVRGFRLANGVVLPARGYLANLPVALQELVVVGGIPEYAMNRALFFSEDPADECKLSQKLIQEMPEDLSTISMEQLNELYQHFRLSFADWLSAADGAGALQRNIEHTIFDKILPTFEKRKRLMLLLYDKLSTWFAETDDYVPAKPFIKRRNCLKIKNPGKCSGACMWAEGEGKCKIHIPTKTPLFVVTKDLYIMKLIDELIIFPELRRQLLSREVRTTVQLKKDIRFDDQWILPESSTSWLDLLRMEWSKQRYEQPKFYEEIVNPKAASLPNVNVQVEAAEVVARPEYMYALNDDLLNKLNIALDAGSWSLFAPPTFEGLVRALQAPQQMQQTFTEDSIRNLVKMQGYPIYMIKTIEDTDIFSIKLYAPEEYQMKKLMPRALVVVQIDQATDEGAVESLTTILVHHSDNYSLRIYINKLPRKLQYIFNNMKKAQQRGELELIKMPERGQNSLRIRRRN